MVRTAQAAADVDGRAYDMRHRIVRPDGEVRWIHERARVERDPAGRPIRYIGVTRDVTEEKLAEDSLRASEARNAAVIEAAVDCLIVIDADGKVTGFNPAAERLFGYQRAEVLGRDLASLIVPERFQAAHRAALRRNLDSGDRRYLDRRIEVILHRADGSELCAEVLDLPLRGRRLSQLLDLDPRPDRPRPAGRQPGAACGGHQQHLGDPVRRRQRRHGDPGGRAGDLVSWVSSAAAPWGPTFSTS